MNSKVWVVQEGNNDYASAEEFGEVNFITTADLNKLENSQQNENVKHDVRKFINEYLQGDDYIIMSGNPMVSALVILSLRGGSHNFLKWDGRRAVYVPFKIQSVRGQ